MLRIRRAAVDAAYFVMRGAVAVPAPSVAPSKYLAAASAMDSADLFQNLCLNTDLGALGTRIAAWLVTGE